MSLIAYKRINGIRGSVTPPADKSITHRAFILAAMAHGRSKIHNPLLSLDTQATLAALQAVGVEVTFENRSVIINSNGFARFRSPQKDIDCGNSGTTARLLMGLLAPAGITARLDGDESLRKRPMARVIEPLRAMGADISGEKLPIKISPALMHSADIVGKVASAQVKSAILLAGMQLPDVTSYTEPLLTRNHTERMMPMFGVEIRKEGNTSYVGGGKIEPCELTVPGDISSAAMLIAAAYIYGNSEITVRQVGLNPTRTAFIDILKSWGADIARDSALCGDIIVKSSALSGGEISGSMSAYAIDELPLLAALGLFTDNGVVIKDAAELRHKECDRISAMVHNLRLLGAEVEEFDDGLAVSPLKDGKSGVLFDSMGDHRIAMINIMLAKRWEGGINSDDLAALKVSFPTFINELERLEIK